MSTAKEEIREWLEEAKANGATHLLVVMDYVDFFFMYPVEVLPSENVLDVCDIYDENGPNGAQGQRVLEVYALHLDLQAQLDEVRCFNTASP